MAEDRRPALGLIAADPLEDAGPVVQAWLSTWTFASSQGTNSPLCQINSACSMLEEKYANTQRRLR